MNESTEALTVALRFYLVRQLVVADDHLDHREMDRLGAVEAHALELGVIGEDRTIPFDFDVTIELARARLRYELSQDAKTEIIDELVQIAAADGELEPREAALIEAAALDLGLKTGVVGELLAVIRATL